MFQQSNRSIQKMSPNCPCVRGHSSALSSHYELLPNNIVWFIVIFFAIIVPSLKLPLSLLSSLCSCHHGCRWSHHRSLRAHATPLLVAVASTEGPAESAASVTFRRAMSPFNDLPSWGPRVEVKSVANQAGAVGHTYLGMYPLYTYA